MEPTKFSKETKEENKTVTLYSPELMAPLKFLKEIATCILTFRIAKDGYIFIFICALLGLFTSRFSKTLSKLSYFAAFCCAVFFRDPKRDFILNENNILSPADGQVVGVDECDECEYINGPVTKISIFMSVLNVHINRAPIAGTVNFIKYKQGKFDAAFDPRASFDNEMNFVGIANDKHKVLVKQVAGILARRIVCDVTYGDVVEQCERIGMIKFSSRVEIFIPKSDKLKINVSVMDNVAAGETVVAEYVD